MEKLILEELKRMREIMFFDDESKKYLIEKTPSTPTNTTQTNTQDQNQDKYSEALNGPTSEFNSTYDLDLKTTLLSGTDPTTAKVYPTETLDQPTMVKVTRNNQSTIWPCTQKVDPKTKQKIPMDREHFTEPFVWAKFAAIYQDQLLRDATQQYRAEDLAEKRVNLQYKGVEMCKKICENISLISKGIDLSSMGPDAQVDKATGKLIFQQKGTGTNNYIEPRISVTEQTQGKTTYWDIVGFGYFPTSVVTSTFVSAFIKKIQTEVFKSPKIVEAIKNGQKDLITMTLANVRGGASNYYGGKTPAEISGLTDANVGKPTIKSVSGDSNFTKNKELARKRANNVLTAIKTQLPASTSQKIRISKSLKETVSGYVVDTGGVDDNNDKRDWNTYPIPGQHVYIFMRIELRSLVEPTKPDSKKCLFNTTISMDFGIGKPERKHKCDSATFDVFANGINIGQIDLGNMNICLKKVDTFGVQGVTATSSIATEAGGPVSGSLKIASEELTDKIIDASVSGEVKITIKGKDNTYYSKRGLPTRYNGEYNYNELSTHSEIPWIKVTSPTNVVLYNQEPESKQTITRCGGNQYSDKDFRATCEEWSVAEFNPCAKNVTDGTLSTILDKTT